MRRIAYKSVLERVEALWLAARGEVSVLDGNVINVLINQWAAQIWEMYFWPDIKRVERRQFRPSWDAGTAYLATSPEVPVEVYDPPSGKYMQSIRAGNLNHAPSMLSGGSYVVNAAWWAEGQANYSASAWLAGAVYEVGQMVERPDDGENYQCHTAHTSGGSFDAAKFGRLVPFRRCLYYDAPGETAIDAVEAITDVDPRMGNGCEQSIDFIAADAIDVGGTQARVWVSYRPRCPVWRGDLLNIELTYAAGAIVYEDTEGDYFESLQNGNTTHAVTETGWWRRIEFPYVFRDAVALRVYSDLLRGDGQHDKALVEEGRAAAVLNLEFDKYERQQRQSRQLPVAI